MNWIWKNVVAHVEKLIAPIWKWPRTKTWPNNLFLPAPWQHRALSPFFDSNFVFRYVFNNNTKAVNRDEHSFGGVCVCVCACLCLCVCVGCSCHSHFTWKPSHVPPTTIILVCTYSIVAPNDFWHVPKIRSQLIITKYLNSLAQTSHSEGCLRIVASSHIHQFTT